MRICLVNPVMIIGSDQATSRELHFFPEGLVEVAASMVGAGHEMEVVDLAKDEEELLETTTDVEMYGLTGIISQVYDLRRLIRRLRGINPEAKIKVGGAFASCAPEPVREYLQPDEIHVGGGLGNHSSEILQSAYALFDLPWYLGGRQREHLRIAGLQVPTLNNYMTSLGCPYSCFFCAQPHGKKIQFKGEERIRQELEIWHQAGARSVRLQDDNLTLLPQQKLQVVLKILSDLGMTWAAHSRVDEVTRPKLELMKSSGLRLLYFGFESRSPDALGRAHKQATIDQEQTAVDLCREAGVQPGGFFLLGLPGETEESLRAMIKFTRKNRLLVTPYILLPIPGIPCFEMAQSQIEAHGGMEVFLEYCQDWEGRQMAEGKLFVNLTDLPDQLLLETYQHLLETGGGIA